jgi:1-acyl-sn-glycerol-3-phosphate acyltransferase
MSNDSPRFLESAPAAPVRRTLLHRLLFALTVWLLRGKLFRHLAWFEGVRNVPTSGPFIIVANHQSYFDDFLVGALVWLLFGRLPLVPTKVKAFKPWVNKVWHEALGGIPIDPAQPGPAYAAMEALLHEGHVLLLFPEGRRSDGGALLPFRYGAFNLAARLRVPVLPAALRGTGRVLPIGRRRFVAGQTASLSFGELILPDGLPEAAELDEKALARAICARARDAIERLAYPEAVQQPAADAAAREVADVARLVEARVEALLDGGVENIRHVEARRLLDAARLGLALGASCPALDVQRVRALGFWVMTLPRLVAPCFVPRLSRAIAAALRADPQHPFVQYSRGQLELRLPRLLGGRKERAVEALGLAYASAEAYGLDRARFAFGLASALAAVRRDAEALNILRRHFGACHTDEPPRLRRRRLRARKLLLRISGRAERAERRAPPRRERGEVPTNEHEPLTGAD